MLRFLFLLGLFAQLAMITSEEPLYPNLSCHPTYRLTPKSWQAGEGWILDSMDYCKEPKNFNRADGCYKECIFQRHSILNYVKPTPEEMQQMGGPHAFDYMFTDEQIGTKVANRIVSECSEKLKEANEKKIPCEDREEFYTCVENAWKC